MDSTLLTIFFEFERDKGVVQRLKDLESPHLSSSPTPDVLGLLRNMNIITHVREKEVVSKIIKKHTQIH